MASTESPPVLSRMVALDDGGRGNDRPRLVSDSNVAMDGLRTKINRCLTSIRDHCKLGLTEKTKITCSLWDEIQRVKDECDSLDAPDEFDTLLFEIATIYHISKKNLMKRFREKQKRIQKRSSVPKSHGSFDRTRTNNRTDQPSDNNILNWDILRVVSETAPSVETNELESSPGDNEDAETEVVELEQARNSTFGNFDVSTNLRSILDSVPVPLDSELSPPVCQTTVTSSGKKLRLVCDNQLSPTVTVKTEQGMPVTVADISSSNSTNGGNPVSNFFARKEAAQVLRLLPRPWNAEQWERFDKIVEMIAMDTSVSEEEFDRFVEKFARCVLPEDILTVETDLILRVLKRQYCKRKEIAIKQEIVTIDV